ncbi:MULTISPECIES: creatininase family protein [Bosea]|uniref:creatininase family protein n=1 Tax=Bosea TaxID=85413 RepID=UPI0021504808|nr:MULTISPECIES: creatininase family protein [Bosea]MCR4522046.1 creatininase family protein [Bosea sp. 47.2.35]MDR6829476.1 creatinine amidohydrolase [Bosea robiniae]MDR6896359.1 creatinine amidohydrolase [Bosea sp. BE109]MDR7139757.1 creatinine amidohydrolase [Bosea sp. BE168]MDR7176521.1 creatinine amidohydrolase [Bosea sp. BE271]
MTRSSSVLWMDLTAEELRAKAATDTIVVLPVASIEQHGPHLPVGVDTILCSGVCKAAAERAGDVDVVVAPTLWCGMAEHHMAFGGTFTFDIPTYRAVLLSFLKSIERHGFHRVLIVNGHGGNIAALSAFLPDFARETRLHVEATTYFMLAQDAFPPLLQDQKGVQHACEVETSMMMVLAPGSVREPRLAEAFGARDGLPGRATVSRHRSFREMTETGVVGDARRATPEKGQACLDACADALAGLLREMGRAA